MHFIGLCGHSRRHVVRERLPQQRDLPVLPVAVAAAAVAAAAAAAAAAVAAEAAAGASITGLHVRGYVHLRRLSCGV